MKIVLPKNFLKISSCWLLLILTTIGLAQTEVRLPDADVATGTWAAVPLWSKINGIGGAVITTPNSNNAANTTGEVTIQNPTNAGTYTSITVRFDAEKNGSGNGGATRGLSANIRINGILQTEQNVVTSLTTTLTSYTVSWTNLNLTQAEMNSLQVVFTSTGDTGSGGNLRFVIIDYLEVDLTYCTTPAAPTAVTATNATICEGSSSNLNATSIGNEIRWYTVPTGGTALITTLSGVNYTVSPTVTTTYYAEALAGGRCVSATRTPVTVTVNSLSVAGTVSANQAICSGAQPDDITLTGSNGSIQWQSSSNNVTFTNISGATGSILSGATIGALASTTYFRAVVTSGVCTPVNSASVTVAIESTTWNGTWSNGTPTATKAVIFTADYSSEPTVEIEACSILVTNNANVSISSGRDVIIRGSITVDPGSTFTLASNANLIQQTDVANTGAITVKRNTSSEVKRLDYNLWSSPVAGQNLLAFSPETLTNRFYVYNPTSNLYSAVPPATTDFAAGTGYLIRMPNTFSADTPGIWEGTFTGVPNNGTYTITLGNDTFNAIGNPYPSTVDLDAFLAANPTDGTVYFWRKTNNALNSSYATYVPGTGAANLGGGSTIVPNATLQVGQGFIVKSTGTAFTFTNAMRIADHGNQFLRTAGENTITTEPASQKSRLWLNLNSNVGIAGQIVVGYVPNATQGIDAGIDGRYINDSPNAFTSIINGEEFIIQGRSLPFTTADVVPLGFKTTVAGAYTIALNQVDGFFTDETLPIFIKDNVTGTEHNLRTGAYEFTAVSGVFNGRFELKYQSTLAVANPIAEASTLIYRQEQALQVKVSNETLTAVTVYDLTGRVIASLNNLSTNEASLALGRLSSQVLLVRVQTQSGDLVRKVLW